MKNLIIFGGYFDVTKRQEELKEKQEKLQYYYDNNDYNSENVVNLSKEINNDIKLIDDLNNLKETLDSYIEIIDSNDEELMSEIKEELLITTKKISELELETKLNGKNDKNNAIIEIHSGAGGTESCDWADMLYRMYTRYFEKKGYKYEIIDTLAGEEAGIKKVILLVEGLNAYGYLKCENGVHRLVRLSPFDSNNRRHTSFASVTVMPEVDDDINIEIKESDIRVDVYRSSGAGGQGVNTTDSAVRITYLPDNIVVTCQNERSQLKNKEQAMKILKSKLYAIEEEKRLLESKENNKNLDAINFGSQIRSYVMHPYSLVKDHRTGYETSNVGKVLDGDIDEFIEEYLNWR